MAFSTAEQGPDAPIIAHSFNPPCGCVAFSTVRRRGDNLLHRGFQSALRMRGLFNLATVASATVARAMFQSALRMRGLFNAPTIRGGEEGADVSIRLADAWPFQLLTAKDRDHRVGCFNPPCGCVAFSTPSPKFVPPNAALFQSALRMRGLFNVYETIATLPLDSWFQSALRMRGLFNSRARRENVLTRCLVSIRLADAWPFQLDVLVYRSSGGLVFQSALRMRGLFNRQNRGIVARATIPFQSALRMRGLFNRMMMR